MCTGNIFTLSHLKSILQESVVLQTIEEMFTKHRNVLQNNAKTAVGVAGLGKGKDLYLYV